MTEPSLKVTPVTNRGKEPELDEETVVLCPEGNISLHQDEKVLAPFMEKSQKRRLKKDALDMVTIRGKRTSHSKRCGPIRNIILQVTLPFLIYVGHESREKEEPPEREFQKGHSDLGERSVLQDDRSERSPDDSS